MARERQARSKENNPKPCDKVAPDVSNLLYNALIKRPSALIKRPLGVRSLDKTLAADKLLIRDNMKGQPSAAAAPSGSAPGRPRNRWIGF